jgi:hypothetical protein
MTMKNKIYYTTEPFDVTHKWILQMVSLREIDRATERLQLAGFISKSQRNKWRKKFNESLK